jgi:hypothetical protein
MMSAANVGASTIVKVLGDTSIKEDLRLKAAQELAETFESNVNNAGYAAFLEMTMKTFLKVLQEGECHFFSDFNIQQVSIFTFPTYWIFLENFFCCFR